MASEGSSQDLTSSAGRGRETYGSSNLSWHTALSGRVAHGTQMQSNGNVQ